MSTFIDEVILQARAGDGGNGIVAWRREAHVPKGGPAGGDGGDGGDVVFVADEGVHSLLDFKYRPHLFARNGQPGRGKNQAGEGGTAAVARVPVGTQVFDADTDELLADLTAQGAQFVACRGGNGGFGNSRFATASRQAPEFAKPGLPGEERRIRLSLKLMADVGLLGFPNAGKSTFLARVSAARPKIAAYPFTTLVPQLGVVRVDDDVSFIMADIPGIIEGASEGKGLGIQFLKHLERVRVLCHLVEVPLETAAGYDDAEDGSHHKTRGPVDLVERYSVLRNELAAFSPELADVPEIVALNKTDLLDSDVMAHPAAQRLKAHLDVRGVPLVCVSAATGAGLKELLYTLHHAVKRARTAARPVVASPFARVRVAAG